MKQRNAILNGENACRKVVMAQHQKNPNLNYSYLETYLTAKEYMINAREITNHVQTKETLALRAFQMMVQIKHTGNGLIKTKKKDKMAKCQDFNLILIEQQRFEQLKTIQVVANFT